MRFGKVDTFLLLGGGVLLSESAVKLKEAGYTVLVVTSQRHFQETISNTGYALGQHIESHGVEYFVSNEVNVDQRVITRITPRTLGLSLGAAWIFRKDFIDQFERKLVNLHGARLPQDRGGGSLSWPILRDNRLGFCLIHQVDAGVDTGPIVKYREFFYPTWCRIPKDYQQVYVQENRKFLTEFFGEVRNEAEFRCIDQLEYLSTYWPRLSTEHHGYVDWSWSLRDLERFVCAFDEPYRGASSFVKGRRVFLKSCFVSFADGAFHPFQKGLIYRKSEEAIFVATEEGTLIIQCVVDEEGRDVKEKIRVGDRLHTPMELLERAKQFRAEYPPNA